MQWRKRGHKFGNDRGDQRAMLAVGAALAPWSKEVKISQMVKDFCGNDEFVSESEWDEISAAAKAENKERFPDGYPESWNKKNKSNRSL